MLIKLIHESTGISRKHISTIIRSASYRYKVYYVDKRTEGKRLIAQPARELKVLQRWIAENIFELFPVHNRVFSYRKGIGIIDIANLHRKYNYLLKLDFKDFFPSITGRDIEWFILQNREHLNVNLTKKDVKSIRSISCRKDQLAIGAPSSPIISNVLLYPFDIYWNNYSKSQKIVYSRYADDLYFSTNTPQILYSLPKKMEGHLRHMKHPNLTINDKKTVFTSRKHTKLVTGLTITPDKKVSIGRAKKRYIKSLVFKYCTGDLSVEENSYLRGFLSYTKSVDPDFIRSLNKKYGKDKIKGIFNEELISLKS
jgi:RNA-directed DNA polymerase